MTWSIRSRLVWISSSDVTESPRDHLVDEVDVVLGAHQAHQQDEHDARRRVDVLMAHSSMTFVEQEPRQQVAHQLALLGPRRLVAQAGPPSLLGWWRASWLALWT